MIIFKNSDVDFIKKHIPQPERIINARSVREALLVFAEYINTTQECWDSSGLFYSRLGNQAQQVYDNIRISNGLVETV